MAHSKKQKAYLVTGAAGFIGARFVESCNRLNIPLVSVDHRACFEMRQDYHRLNFGEQVDVEELGDWLARENFIPSAIVHLGAITDTRESDLERLSRYNTGYTRSLWDYATEHQIPFVYASSAATYGDGAWGYDDDEKLIPKLKPLNAYGDSKQEFDLWALEQEKKSHHPPSWAGFKFFNVYGFGEEHKGFMASVVLHAYQEILSRGQATLFKSHRPGIADGDQKRDFVFVEDVVDVLHFALNTPVQRGIFNLGSGKARSFMDLCRAVFRALDLPEQIHFVDTPEAIREKYQYFTEAKMERLRAAGYLKEFTSLEDGVRAYVRRLRG